MQNTAIYAFAARHYENSTICCVRRIKKFRLNQPEFSKSLQFIYKFHCAVRWARPLIVLTAQSKVSVVRIEPQYSHCAEWLTST